jgi:hypothetical protein
MARKPRRSIVIHRFPTTEPHKFIEIDVAYNEGGMQAFSGHVNARAYYMHVTPIKLETLEDGVEIKSYTLFRGRKYKLEDAKRFSQNKFLTIVEKARLDCASRTDNVMSIVNFVAAEENLTLAEDAVTA